MTAEAGPKDDRREALRFVAVGLGATAIYVALGDALMRWAGASAALAGALAFTGSTSFSYALQKTATFRSKRRHSESAPRFLAVALIGLAIAAAGPAWLHAEAGLPAPLAFGLSAGAVAVLSYATQKFWVFAGERASPAAES